MPPSKGETNIRTQLVKDGRQALQEGSKMLKLGNMGGMCQTNVLVVLGFLLASS